MKSLWSLFTLSLSFSLCLAASQLPADTPLCATSCLVQTLSKEPYSQLNQEQLCHDKGFSQVLGDCVVHSCTVRESLDFINSSRTACGLPVLDRRVEIRLASLIMGAVAVVFFAMRMTAKALSLYSWGADDVLIIVSFVFLISFVIIIQLMIPQGLGLDIWVLNDGQITVFLKYFFVLQIDYTLTLALIKASILCFFLRIFPDTKFRTAVWGTLVVNILTGLIYVVLNFFQRRPLSLIWEGWKDMPPRGVVLDLDKMALSHSFINIALDIWMLILPLTQLYKLGLKLKKKIGVIAMFSVGVFLTVVSVVRVHSILDFTTAKHATASDSQWAMIWSCIEVCVGVMVACMPHTRQLMMHLLSKRKARSTVDTSSGSEQLFINRSLERIFDLDSDGTTPAVSDKGGCCRPGRPARNHPVALSHVGDAGAKV